MLTIGKLTPGRASYYCEQLPGGQDEYYTDSREQPGVWLGSAAERLGLVGPVDPDQFRALLDARRPMTGEALGVPRTTGRRLAGYDLCLSAPKSVSVAWALAPPELAEKIAAAHDHAVASTVAALEAEGVRARRGAGGHQRVTTGGVAAAAFGHCTSRAGDPQIHTHLVVANVTPDAAGRWTAVDGATLYRWAKTLGYLYQAELRAELTRQTGMEWGPVRNGAADLAGMDPAVTETFSKRSAQIAAALGGPSAGVPLQVAKTATLATRTAKAELPPLTALRLQWAAEAAALGLDPTAVEALTGRAGPHRDDPDRLGQRLLSADGLTAHASTFDRRDILQHLAAGHRAGRSAAELRADADRLVAHPEVVTLIPGPGGARYTTVELLEVEGRLVAGAGRRARAGVGRAAGHLDRILAERPGLSAEQQKMVNSLVTSGAGVEVVIGRAGAGKTYALDAARAAWQAGGHHVIGAALAARAAAELESGAGIPATTIDRLLADLDRPGPLSALPPRTCLIVDEAGMVGTRKLARLLAHAERSAAKVVLVGDHRQLPEIEAGGAVAALRHTVPTTELVDNRRQIHPWERTALAELRSGDVPAAFTAYSDAGRVHLSPAADQARQAMVDDWWEARRSGQHAVMYALRRSDVADLNQRARHHLERAGLLGADRLEAGGRDFAVGDVVLCRRNDRRLGVRNGTTATIADLDPRARTVILSNGTVLPGDYLDAGHLDHGYATTIHKAQGATVDRALLLGSAGLYREAGYVGLSRGRERSDLYIVAPSTPAVTEVDPVAETIRALGTSRAHTLASSHLQLDATDGLRPQGPHRETREAAALAADPPTWLTAALGPPPLRGPDRDRWTRDAARLAAYRGIYAITDPIDALGPRPADPDQRRAWDLARLTLIEHDRRLELDQGLHL